MTSTADIYYDNDLQKLLREHNLVHKKYRWAININLFGAICWGSLESKASRSEKISYIGADNKLTTVTYRFQAINCSVYESFLNRLKIKHVEPVTGSVTKSVVKSDESIVYGHIVEIMTLATTMNIASRIYSTIATKYDTLARSGSVTKYTDNMSVLSEIYTKGSEFIVADRIQSLTDTIEQLQIDIDAMHQSIIDINNEHRASIKRLTDEHQMTKSHYVRQMELIKKDAAQVKQLNNMILQQQMDTDRKTKITTYRIPFTNFVDIFDLPFELPKNDTIMKFLEDNFDEQQMYYVTHGHDNRFIDHYNNTAPLMPGLFDIFSDTGSIITLTDSRKTIVAAIRISSTAILSAYDPVKLLSPGNPLMVYNLIHKKE